MGGTGILMYLLLARNKSSPKGGFESPTCCCQSIHPANAAGLREQNQPHSTLIYLVPSSPDQTRPGRTMSGVHDQGCPRNATRRTVFATHM